MSRKKLFGSSFIDEVSLFEEIKRYKDIELTEDFLQKINAENGLDQATAILYEYLSKKHHAFISAIDSQQPRVSSLIKPLKLIIVPGMFYKEYPEMGGDGLFIKEIAKKFGIKCELVNLHSRGSVSQNKIVLKEKLLKENHENVWIISFSKGSTEVRLCLEELKEERVPNNIKGWISIAGLLKGTFLGDEKLQSFFTKTIWYATSKILGINHYLSKEMSLSNPLLKKHMALPSDLEIIHIIGVPLASHLQQSLTIKRYPRLAKFGPNDGIINLGDFLELPGNVYPLWGTDHFFRSHNISALIYKMLNYINK